MGITKKYHPVIPVYHPVIPAKAGIHIRQVDPRLRGGDGQAGRVGNSLPTRKSGTRLLAIDRVAPFREAKGCISIQKKRVGSKAANPTGLFQ